MSFLSSSTTSRRSRLYLVMVRTGDISWKTEAMISPGRLPKASISLLMSSSVRLRVQRLMKPWLASPCSWSAWKSIGVIVRIRFFTFSACRAA